MTVIIAGAPLKNAAGIVASQICAAVSERPMGNEAADLIGRTFQATNEAISRLTEAKVLRR